MASHVVVIATDLRRTTVKVNPGTYLSDVLQEACQKLKLSSDKYLVKYKQKQVDLSVPFRTSGLIPGAKLELVLKSNTPSAVQVALQVPLPEGKEIPGGRLIHKFPSTLSVWQVLRQFESGKASQGNNINFTSRGVAQTAQGQSSGAGQLYYETPVLNIMGRELATFVDFQKTLSQLGYNSGNVLIRLSYQKTEKTLFDAMGEISEYFAEESEETTTETSATTKAAQAEAAVGEVQEGEAANAFALDDEASPQIPRVMEEKTESADAPQDQDDAMDIDTASAARDPLRPVTVFRAPSADTPAAALAPRDEADYVPTVAHAQIHQARLLQSSRNKRLPSDRELEEKAAAEEARIAALKSITIKVRFPDNTSADWEASPSETGAFLYEAVRHVMAHSDQPFRLVLPGGKPVIKDENGPSHTLIKAYRLSGRTLVNLVWDDRVPANIRKQPFLKSAVAQHSQAIKVPEVPRVTDEAVASQTQSKAPEKSSESGEGGGGKKVPKWFKFGKK